MKGNIKNKIRSLIFIAVFILSAMFVCVGMLPYASVQHKSVRALHEIYEGASSDNYDKYKKVSALVDGNILLSVEKVWIGEGLSSTVFEEGSAFTSENKSQKETKYVHIPEKNGFKKSVVADGSYVMIENDNAGKSTLDNRPGENASEALVITFGQYYLNKESEIKSASGGVDADIEYPIQRLQVNATLTGLDGELKSFDLKDNVRQVGTVGDNGYLDFAYILDYTNLKEGKYEFSFDYFTEHSYSTTFSFYVMKETSYSGLLTYGEGISEISYTQLPTLGWNEKGAPNFEQPSGADYVQYYVGVNGLYDDGNVSFPTITYDYTRYTFRYTHTSKNETSEYVFVPNLATNTITFTKDGTAQEPVDARYDNESDKHIATVVLTEPGQYNFKFEYIYLGDTSAAAGMNLKIEDKKLQIHDTKLLYKKTDFKDAVMSNLSMSDNKDHNVALIVPNAVKKSDINSYRNKRLEMVYELDIESTLRVGDVNVSERVDDVDVLKSHTGLANFTLGKELVENIENLEISGTVIKLNNSVVDAEKWNEILENIPFEKTNFSALKFDITDAINSFNPSNGKADIYEDDDKDSSTPYVLTNKGLFRNSYYYYSKTKPTAESLADVSNYTHYSDLTTFNKIGYYIVVLRMSGYTQIFAFEYTSNSTNANITDIYSKPVGDFTNKDIIVNWTPNAIFEREISAVYYELKDDTSTKGMTSNEIIDKVVGNYNAIPIGNGDKLTSTASGHFTKYVIELKKEGASSSCKMVVVDKQDITGIKAHAVSKIITADNSTYYTYATNYDGSAKIIENFITDSYATLKWNHKDSGAKVKITYSFTPFKVYNFADDEKMAVGNGYKTNYRLGSTINGSELIKGEDNSSTLNYSSLVDEQGIYVFTAEDQAGNITKYMLIIDQTEAYYKVTDKETAKFVTNESLFYSDDVRVDIGAFKAIYLYGEDGAVISNDLKNIIENINNDTALNDLDFYKDENYRIRIANLFNKDKDSNLFIKVDHKELKVVDIVNKEIDFDKADGKLDFGGDQILAKDEYSLVYRYYIKSANNLYSGRYEDHNSSNSKLTIEVNADNSQGFVYFSDSKTNSVPAEGQSGAGKYRLFARTNSDGDLLSGIQYTHATSSSYVGFVWNMGSDAGAYKVKSVKYNFYEMDLNSYNNDGHYFKLSKKDQVIYQNGEFGTVNITARALGDEAGRAFVWFGTSGTTAPGLYVIERTYEGEVAEGSKDSKTLYYFFIVDRTGIIDSGVGDGICLEMLIDGTKENDFKKPTTNTGEIRVDLELNTGKTQEGAPKTFKKYLTTSKVPTTIRIPAGKFYKYDAGTDSVQTSANYFAGQLSYTLYYIQTHDQVYGSNGKVGSNEIIQLFTSNTIADNGYFILDLTQIGMGSQYKELFINEHGDWVYLPGTYVIELKDNVQNTQYAHNYQYIGFVIEKGQAPQTDINTGFDESNLITAQPSLTNNKTSEYRIVTSDEFVHIELPEYIEGVKNKPQIDVDYIIVERNGQTILDSVSLQTDTLYTSKHDDGNPNGAKTIKLPTNLRDEGNKNILVDNFDEELIYTIKVRYKVNNGAEDYSSAYKYVADDDEDFRTFYETTYTIIIDRIAPQGNINNLVNNDSLLKQYYQDLLNNNTVFENTYQETGENSKIYFFTRYNEYYKGKDISKLYAFNVAPATEFITDDVERVLFRKLDKDNYNLSLPIISENGYTVKNSSKITTYGDLFGRNADGSYVFAEGYYEIVEIDYAGNATQYVILYNTQETLQFNFNYKATNGKQLTQQLTNTEDVHLYMFEITGLQDESFVQDSHFMRVELSIANGEILVSESLNFATDLNALISNIVSKINKTGTYNLKFVYRTRTENGVLQLSQHTVYISLYSEQDKVELNANKLWSKTNTGYIINLQGANEVVDGEAGRITYFATKVIIKYTYNKEDIVETYTSEDGIIYKNDLGIAVETTFACWPNTSYRIELIDLFEQSKTTMFNTGDKNFFNVEFARPGNLLDNQETGNYYLFNGVYYAFTDLNLSYDSTLFELQTNQTDYTHSDKDASGYRTFTVKADGKKEFKVWFVAGENEDEKTTVQEYFFVLDNSIGEVLLIDFNNADKKDMVESYNKLIEEMEGSEKTYSGIMNLTWTLQENDYFDYEYILYEVVNAETGERTITDLTGKKAHTIQTDKDNPGIYYFEVNVYSKPDENGNKIYLGNKLYAFNVLSENNRLYYVEKDGVAISHNSSITIKEIKDTYFPSSTNDIFKDVPTSEIPLFISNTELKVVANDDYVKEIAKVDVDHGKFYLALYKISSSTYSKYLALLIVKHDAKIISDLKVNNNLVNDQQDIMIVKTPTDANQDVYIQGTKVYNNKEKIDNILSKNLLTMEIYYNGKNINQTVILETDSTHAFSYKIPGSGQYMFVFKDLAGNVYEINPKALTDKTLLKVEVLRELTLYVNGELAIENALYNNVNLIEIYSSLKFATGTISIDVYKNGSVYKSTTSSSVTIEPKDYGTYKVVARASYQTENMDQPIEFEKTIKFTIINGQEVRPSINLNALYDYSIAYVTTTKGVNQITNKEELIELINTDENNVTEIFKSILNEGKMFVHYDNLKHYAQELNLVTGKQEFTIIYMVEENGYPTRYVNFTFTLNNEVPKIECSLPAGETTTDGFDIIFNASIIYQQIGECYIKINGVEVMHIVNGEANHIQTIHKSFAQDGAGTFLITLESPSENIWYSYNAVIKEPLNTWAIVIIVIVVAVVIGVTITIIVLRNKMRIR